MLALQRPRMPQPLLSVQADVSRAAAIYVTGMLRELPFKTIGDVGRHGLELHVYCPRCYRTRRPVNLERWADRCFATARFRCGGMRHDGAPCRATGMPVIGPPELVPVGGPVTLAFLSCSRCIWEINQVRLDQPPWSGSRQRYRCPGCGGRVEWHIHGPAWRPSGSTT
jgi:transposase-like protein